MDVGGAQIPVNRHFADNPGMVLGDLAAGGARRADDLQVIAPVGTDVAAGLAQALAGAAAGRAAPAPRPATPSPVTGRPPEGYQQARADGTFTRMTGRFFEPFDPPGGPAGQAELRALLGLRDAAIALLDAELATTEDAGLVDDLRADLNTRYDAYVAAYGPVNRYTPQVKIRSTPEGRALREQLLAEGQARFTGGKLEISDPAVRDQLIADGHATVTEMGELRFGRTRAAHDERHRLLDSGQARALGGTFTLTETGRARVLENAADLQERGHDHPVTSFSGRLPERPVRRPRAGAGKVRPGNRDRPQERHHAAPGPAAPPCRRARRGAERSAGDLHGPPRPGAPGRDRGPAWRRLGTRRPRPARHAGLSRPG